MNKDLQYILDFIRNSEHLSEKEKAELTKAVKDADKELEVTAFKLERTEKVKKTTAILLEETIEELEQKRKAVEAQNRELEIEAALERVRAQAMGMAKADDILNICKVLFDELVGLGYNHIRNSLISIFNDDKKFFLDYDYSDKLGKSIIKIAYDSHPIIENFMTQIRKATDAFVEIVIDKNQLDGWKEFRRSNGEANDPTLDNIDYLYYYIFAIGSGSIGISTFQKITTEQRDILKRFRNVFKLSYQRYKDIEQAEAQAREAKVQASLEKVRTVALTMKRSDEMLDIAQALYEQLLELGFKSMRNTIIDIHNENDETFLDYDYSHDMGKTVTLMSYHVHPIIEKQVRKIESSSDAFFEIILEGQDLQDLIDIRLKNGEEDDPRLHQIEQLTYNLYSFGNGAIGISNFGLLSNDQKKVLKRFRNVFAFAYKRYKDMVQAEAQAREAQIEAALERVRSRTMGMQKSVELKEVIQLVYEQFIYLNINVEHTGFIMDYKARDDMHIWLADKHEVPFEVTFPYFDCGHWNSFIEAKEKGLNFFANLLSFEEKNKFYKDLFALIPGVPEETAEYYFSCPGLAISTVLLENVGLYIENFSGTPYSDEENQILMRFGKVFQQTYTRFLDLQRAEAQAREAQIEAALERVRGYAMAMHNSSHLSATASLVFTELKKLGISPIRSGVGLISKDEHKAQIYSTTSSGNEQLSLLGTVTFSGHPVFREQYEHWLKKKNFFAALKGEELSSYYRQLSEGLNMELKTKFENDKLEFGHWLMFSEGFLYAWSDKKYSEAELNILDRFKKVIELTFKRYLDLKKAEAQAREAIKQASLDRIRGEIASMRTAEDLNRITPIIWRELKTLEVPFIRCGVFIVDEENQNVQVYLTTPDGKSLAAMNLPLDANELTSSTVNHWRKKQVYKEHWNKEEFINWTRSLIEIGLIQNIETYQGSSEPPETLDLHFVPFTQGMLYVGDISPLTDDNLELVKTIAEAFSIAYARYEDFKNLEEAKNRIETTLKELKAAQAQLIHTEKMASLGELTAGIAHEIKNPLNFVTNFSDLSRDLIDDVKEELQNKNNDEVLALLEDLKQNLEKINQHGKRADSIVKGMLQHSRGTSGEKALTDINNLLDQYVNLAYHGMRAQNKEFNITIEKYYDETLEKINVVPQDISRVFLNIINNACYAAYDRKKNSDNNFAATLKVSTKNLDGKVEIRIGDNGKGIPSNILDKIFQPFFTTKPTGEGTGLGLSLSYDIVTKVHGGELKVETNEGEGSEFIILLPNKNL